MLAQVAGQVVNVIMTSIKEKEQLQFQLGKMTATAEMLQTRLTETTGDFAIEQLGTKLKKIKKLREGGI